MRKYIVAVVIAAVALVVFFSDSFSESGLNPFDYARITDVDYTAVVVDEPGGNGKILVTERLTFDIHAASRDNLFWELWRDLSEEYIDGVKVEYKVNSVKQIREDGSAIEYGESPRLYWEDYDYTTSYYGMGPQKWYHSEGPYNEASRRYECVFFYVNGLYRETVVFEIEYEMSNAALRYNDCSELYITPYSEGSIRFLNSFNGQILVPNDMMPGPGNYFAHTYGTNTNEFPFIESDTLNPGYHTFAFSLDESDLKFRPYNEYIEFSLVSYGEDRHIFTNYASVNDYYNDDVLDELYEEQAKYEALPEDFRTAKIAVLLVLSVIAVLVVVYALRIDKRMRKKHTFFQPATQYEYYRDIPSKLDPSFAAALLFCKQKPPKDAQDSYAAVMLNLARKGYIKLAKIQPGQDWDASNIKIVVTYTPIQSPDAPVAPALLPTEQLYFNLILRHTNGLQLPLSVFQQKVSADYEYTDAFVRSTKNAIINIGTSQGYFQKADYKQPAKQVARQAWALGIIGVLVAVLGNLISWQTRLNLAFGAFFILGLGFLLAALYLKRASKKYVLLTQFGEDEYAKWRGLYNYFNSSTLLNERTVIELQIWEQYLVYATAFGISDKVIAAINVRCPQANKSPVLSNPYYHSIYFRTSARAFRTATRSATFSARTGGLGGHGGYGGGGRGGGGGGGGH